MTVTTKLILAGAGLAVLVSGYLAWREHQRQIGAKDAIIARERQLSDSLRNRADVLDTVYLRDTVTLTRFTVRLDTLRDTVLARLTDTVLVREFIQVADSTIRACTSALRTCEERTAVERQRRESAERQIAALRRAEGSFLSKIVDRCGLFGGYGVGNGFGGPVAALGCKVVP